VIGATGSAEAGWEAAFAAVGAILGEPLEAIRAALGEGGQARAADVLEALASPSREARARGLTRALSEVALGVAATRLA
jgi:hypothetical protein